MFWASVILSIFSSWAGQTGFDFPRNAKPEPLPAINLRFIIFISVLGLTITFSCKTTTNPPSLTLDKLIQDTSTKKIIIDTADKYITRVLDVGGDTNVGGHYEFYKNGRLKNYNFIYKTTYDTSKEFIQRFHDSLVFFASYGESYDSLGHLDSVYKTPLVYKIVNNRKINDTVDFVFYFFAMDKQYKDVIAKTSNNQTFSLNPMEITVKVYQCFSAKFTARSELL